MGQIDFQFQDGDILLLRVNKFSAWYRAIFAFLIRFFDGVYYHHAQIVCNGMIYEADTKVRIRDFNFNEGDEIMVLRPNSPLSDSELQQLKSLLKAELGREYDYIGAIFHQLIYILTLRRIWIGKTGNAAMRKPYCTELVSGVWYKLRGYFPRPYLTSPWVLQMEATNYFKAIIIIKP